MHALLNFLDKKSFELLKKGKLLNELIRERVKHVIHSFFHTQT